jgi:hypothetical protein
VNEHLVDTKIKLGQCNRCEGYVFMAMSSGVRSAADPAPVSRDGYVAALTDGRRLFRLQTAAGRPQKLLTCRPADLHPSFDPGGAQTGAQSLLAEHGCGGRQRNMITFREIEQGPPSARAKPGSSRTGGRRPEAAPVGGTNPSAAVDLASRRLSDTNGDTSSAVMASQAAWEHLGGPGHPERARRAPGVPRGAGTGSSVPVTPVRCHICDNMIDQQKPFTGIHHGRWVWAIHEECP